MGCPARERAVVPSRWLMKKGRGSNPGTRGHGNANVETLRWPDLSWKWLPWCLGLRGYKRGAPGWLAGLEQVWLPAGAALQGQAMLVWPGGRLAVLPQSCLSQPRGRHCLPATQPSSVTTCGFSGDLQSPPKCPEALGRGPEGPACEPMS